jgi:hypothetical protein
MRRRWIAAALSLGLLAALVPLTQPSGVSAQAAREARSGINDSWSQLLSTIGVLSAGHLYQSYLNIGMLSDAVSKGHYDVSQGGPLLDSIISVIETYDRELTRCSSARVGDEDRQTIQRLKEANQKVLAQGQALKKYWAQEDVRLAEKQHEAYETSRREAWQAVRQILTPGAEARPR